MTRFLLVCLGGALGSGARYLVSLSAAQMWGVAFPWGTFTVNIAGSFLIGLAMSVMPAGDLRLFVTTGVLGGFTTYSAFNYDAVHYLRNGPSATAAIYLIATVAGCLMSGFAGVLIGTR